MVRDLPIADDLELSPMSTVDHPAYDNRCGGFACGELREMVVRSGVRAREREEPTERLDRRSSFKGRRPRENPRG
ncbi:hypothetical protein, partial [Paludisphaera soli]|uniref:hypothetical protein n=1 Tax=Paludisphaera soli TaxID=2712865 RepID=UPI001980985C